jgi:hypothetical protein
MIFTRLTKTVPGARDTALMALTIVLIFVLSLSAPVRSDQPGSALGPPPGDYKILSGASEVTVPFEIFRGDLRMAGEIGGKQVRMMLDNGYMWDPLLTFGSPRIDSLNLHYDGEGEVGGPGAGRPVQSRTASGIVLRFPGIEFAGQTAIVTPESSGLTRMWEGTEGQVSATFLKHFVVSIDFDERMITLTEPSAFRYRGSGAEVPLKPLQGGAWGVPGIIEMSDGRRVSLDLMLDLGYKDQIQIVTGGGLMVLSYPRRHSRLVWASACRARSGVTWAASGESRSGAMRLTMPLPASCPRRAAGVHMMRR